MLVPRLNLLQVDVCKANRIAVNREFYEWQKICEEFNLVSFKTLAKLPFYVLTKFHALRSGPWSLMAKNLT